MATADDTPLPDELRSDDAPESDLEAIVAEYVDRLNEGEGLDRREILAAHPALGPEILNQLDAFIGMGLLDQGDEHLGTLGDFILRRQIGRGGMGIVYDAWQNSMDRRVALKVLPLAVAADPKACARFMREAQAAGRLSHQNVVAVHAMGVEGKIPYYAMDYVEGETLARMLARLRAAQEKEERRAGLVDSMAQLLGKGCEIAAPAPHRAASDGVETRVLADSADVDQRYFFNLAHAFAGAAEGLQHAHTKGVVHRDIKPSNLILDTEGRLRILDFGLARLEGRGSITGSGDFMGTPLYMSPEQARRRAIPIDHRTDIYSLGATLYEMLTWRPPFKGKDDQDTLTQIVERDPVDPTKVNPRVPRDLETIALKCLRKDPADRYGTAEAVAQDLRRFVRGDPIEARPQSRWERLAARLRRNRARLCVAAAFVVLLVAVTWLVHESRRANREARQAAYRPAVLDVLLRIQADELSFRALSGLSELSTGFRPFLDRWAGPIGHDEFRSLVADRALPALRDAAARLAVIAGGLPEMPDAHYHLARAYVLLDRKDQAASECEKALRSHDLPFLPARVLSLELQGHGVESEDFARLRLDHDGREGWERPWLEAYQAARESRRRWDALASAYGKLIAACREGEPYVGCLVESHLGRGAAYLAMRDYPAAFEDFAIVRSRAPGLEPALLLAKAHYLAGNTERARAIFMGLYGDAAGKERNSVAFWIAATYGSIGKYDEGVEWTRRLEELPFRHRLEAYFLWRAGRSEEAAVAGRLARARDPRDPVAHLILASALLSDLLARPEPADGRLSELLEAAGEASSLDPGSALARSLLEAGRGMERQREEERNSTMHRFERTLWVPVALSLLAGTGLAQEGLVGGFFGDVKPLPVHVNQGWVGDPSVTEDGLELYFTRTFDGNEYQLCVARRASTGDAWGPVEHLSELGEAGSLFVMPDGLTIVIGSLSRGVSSATRADRGDPYPAARVPFGSPTSPAGRGAFAPCFTGDGREMYYQYSEGGSWDIFVSWRSGVNEPFDSFKRLEISSSYDDVAPSVSADGLTLFWSDLGDYFGGPCRPGCQPLGNIWYATRTQRWVKDGQGNEVPAPFGPARCLGAPIDGPVNDAFPGVSWNWPHDRSTFYFCRYGPGQLPPSQIWEATWHVDANGNGIADELEPRFLRGDANASGGSDIAQAIDIADAVFTLGYLFAKGAEPACLDAADANDSGEIDIADAITILSHLFADTGPLPAPFAECDIDLTIDELDCGQFSPCEGEPRR